MAVLHRVSEPMVQVNQSEQSYCTIHPITCKTRTNGDFAGTEITAFVCSNVTPRFELSLS